MSGGNVGITCRRGASSSVRAIPRACDAPQHHRELRRPLRPGRQSCGSPRTSCRHRSSFPPPPTGTFRCGSGGRSRQCLARRSVRSLHKRLGFGAMAARTGLPAGIVAGLPDMGSLRRHRRSVGSLRHSLRKVLTRERAEGEHQRHEPEQRSEFAFRLEVHRASRPPSPGVPIAPGFSLWILAVTRNLIFIKKSEFENNIGPTVTPDAQDRESVPSP